MLTRQIRRYIEVATSTCTRPQPIASYVVFENMRDAAKHTASEEPRLLVAVCRYCSATTTHMASFSISSNNKNHYMASEVMILNFRGRTNVGFLSLLTHRWYRSVAIMRTPPQACEGQL